LFADSGAWKSFVSAKGVTVMESIEVKNFATDGDVNEPNNARVETLNIGG
jgi:hypothetical protein